MSDILKRSVRWILTGEEGDIAIPTKEESVLLSMMRSLSQADRDALMQIAKTMAGKPSN